MRPDQPSRSHVPLLPSPGSRGPSVSRGNAGHSRLSAYLSFFFSVTADFLVSVHSAQLSHWICNITALPKTHPLPPDTTYTSTGMLFSKSTPKATELKSRHDLNKIRDSSFLTLALARSYLVQLQKKKKKFKNKNKKLQPHFKPITLRGHINGPA